MSGPPAVVPQAMGPVSPGDSADGRKAKRELSQSKRAAQNRAAQQVRDLGDLESTSKTLQAENYALRDYILRLQSRLLDTQGEYPQPPPGISLHPIAQGQPSHGGPEVSQPTNATAPAPNQVEVAAQAVAGLTRGEHLGGRDPYGPVRTDDDRTAEEITRQLQADGGPDGLPAAPM
ncbi:hypothetical protein CHGG_04746 [Chaetomium globosum CBS 148.51]|uniref:BZIP domain-containing protein n=1 Tax=Chaetomium globosum (strain ATCC 6205 / CBS 148.51 / DSM 1962 / NBRC 6347 / NRRL 1970) TaxID=306901 RepID=Q2H0F0_CHAGB|nr:uncharacterized protein CHGG_04746 [Chaetomium globosum CBS 148.51]EAQ88127.1 hypothetical protein CHGG_04746 [Chaetomium globosum CBS 148.51]